ncbi:CaiB/BaiF CoA transferase family protein [Pseudomonas fluorescens]|uniref:Acetyl-CoA:oxalate CoA-transferase n=1 Tax=Pseudomonas fluorescens TaxID=294 RepID=A0A5E7CQ37_PSEFL|nr:CaiB/BaiF CoA-transferase family protein [Pseudomonas fluorescens]VVN97451.1 Acetyl-CoA:oxalate CoA-transferase [Pseudomonas fluorescens]
MAERQGPLKGFRVVELAGLGPGPYCGMLLSDLGAEVVQVDRPGGVTGGYGLNPSRDVLNRGRRSLTLDLRDPEARDQLLALIAHADGFIEGNRPGVAERLGIGPDKCLRRNPRLVYGRVTGWGQSGPLALAAGHDINYIAVGGALGLCGRPGVPVIPQNFVGDMAAGGLLLAFGMVSALLEAGRSGQGQVVDAAMIDGVASLLSAMLTMHASGCLHEETAPFFGDGSAHFYGVYRTSDGKYLSVGAIEPAFYAAFLRDAELSDSAFDAQWDTTLWPELKEKVARRIAQRTSTEWVSAFSRDACVAPVLSLTELEHHPQHVARANFFREAGVLQASPVPKFSRTPGAVASPPNSRPVDIAALIGQWACRV